MVGNNGEVYLYVDFKNTDAFINNLLGWDNPPRLSQICWLRLKDGNIYSLSDIRRRFLKNNKAKITKEKLIDMGFVPSPQKTCEWEIKWYLDLIGCKELEIYFQNVMQKKTEEKSWCQEFEKFAYAAGFYDELIALYSYLQYEIIEKWCIQNYVILKSNAPEEYINGSEKEKIRKKIIESLNKCEFLGEYAFLKYIIFK